MVCSGKGRVRCGTQVAQAWGSCGSMAQHGRREVGYCLMLLWFGLDNITMWVGQYMFRLCWNHYWLKIVKERDRDRGKPFFGFELKRLARVHLVEESTHFCCQIVIHLEFVEFIRIGWTPSPDLFGMSSAYLTAPSSTVTKTTWF